MKISNKELSLAAAVMGKKGGKSRSPAKLMAQSKNCKKGGLKKKEGFNVHGDRIFTS